MAYYYSPFRKTYDKKQTGCPFCDVSTVASQCITTANGNIVENNSYRWLINVYPKFEGHTMIVPKRHITKIGEESVQEVIDREELITYAAQVLQKAFSGSGIEVFVQTGAGSSSSVQHLHWHVLPASETDILRSFDKLGHFYTIEPGKEKVLIFPHIISKSPLQLQKFLGKYAHTLVDSRSKKG